MEYQVSQILVLPIIRYSAQHYYGLLGNPIITITPNWISRILVFYYYVSRILVLFAIRWPRRFSYGVLEILHSSIAYLQAKYLYYRFTTHLLGLSPFVSHISIRDLYAKYSAYRRKVQILVLYTYIPHNSTIDIYPGRIPDISTTEYSTGIILVLWTSSPNISIIGLYAKYQYRRVII